MTNNSKTDYSEQSSTQLNELARSLSEYYPLPDKLDSIEFLVKKSGLLDEIIMPELLEKFKMENA